MAQQAKLRRYVFLLVMSLAACTVKSQVPEIKFRVTSFDSDTAVASELAQIAVRNDLNFTTGSMRVNQGFLVNTIVKKDNCVVATANSSLNSGFAMIFFYDCKGFDYKVLINEFIDRAKQNKWVLKFEK